MPKRLIRPREAWTRIGCGRSKFYDSFIKTGRLRLISIGPKSTAVHEDELDALIDSLPEVQPAPVERKHPRR
jgi:predicted DNA-binding transcriptional regulator AlpA